jgi:hypothetical protein
MLDIFWLEKAEISICATDAGTKYDVRDEQNEKTESSIRSNFELDSKKTTERDVQP